MPVIRRLRLGELSARRCIALGQCRVLLAGCAVLAPPTPTPEPVTIRLGFPTDWDDPGDGSEDRKTCSKCQTEVSINVHVCPHCFHYLPPLQWPVHAATNPGKAETLCPKCHGSIALDACVCPRCRAFVEGPRSKRPLKPH